MHACDFVHGALCIVAFARGWRVGAKGFTCASWDGPGVGEGAPGATRDEGTAVEVAGLEGEGVVGDGSVGGEGEGG